MTRRLAWLALLLAASACAPSNICTDLVCRYDSPDGGPCHSGPALCCDGERPTGVGVTGSCGQVGHVVPPDQAKDCVNDQPIKAGCA